MDSRYLRSGASGSQRARTNSNDSDSSRSRYGERDATKESVDRRSRPSSRSALDNLQHRFNDSEHSDSSGIQTQTRNSKVREKVSNLLTEVVPLEVRLTPLENNGKYMGKSNSFQSGGNILTDNLFERFAELASPRDDALTSPSLRSDVSGSEATDTDRSRKRRRKRNAIFGDDVSSKRSHHSNTDKEADNSSDHNDTSLPTSSRLPRATRTTVLIRESKDKQLASPITSSNSDAVDVDKSNGSRKRNFSSESEFSFLVGDENVPCRSPSIGPLLLTVSNAVTVNDSFPQTSNTPAVEANTNSNTLLSTPPQTGTTVNDAAQNAAVIPDSAGSEAIARPRRAPPEREEERRLIELLRSRLPRTTVCTCRDESGWTLRHQAADLKCDAVDSIDSRPLVFCTKPVRTPKLVRAGAALPCVTMCDEHLARLANHECCPTCGFFCTLGEFYECTGVGQVNNTHLCHRNCRRFVDGQHHCPHCWLPDCMSLTYFSKPPNVELRDFVTKRPLASVTKGSTKGNASDAGSTSDAPSSRRRRANARMSLSSNDKVEKHETSSVASRQSDGASSSNRPNQMIEATMRLPVCSDPESVRRVVATLRSSYNEIRSIRVTAASLYRDARAGDVEKVVASLACDECFVNTPSSSHSGQTALHAACASGNVLVVGCLLLSGARIDAVDCHRSTPLHVAVATGDPPNVSVVRYLIASGANAAARDTMEDTPLHIAAKLGYAEVCAALVDETLTKKGLETAMNLVNLADSDGYTALAWAAEKNHEDVVRVLLARGADPSRVDLEGNEAVHWAASTDAARSLRLLLDAKPASLSPPNFVGDTPLHIAVRRDQRECALLLLYAGADPRVKNKKGETPLDCVTDPQGELHAQLLLFHTFAQLGADRAITHSLERTVCPNITNGREALPISVVNGVDNEPSPSDFRYITQCLETVPLNINRSINSLSYCECENDCRLSAVCTCVNSSIRCWYNENGRLSDAYEFDRAAILFECSEACRCGSVCGNRVVQRGIRCRLQVFKTPDRGWAVRALHDVPRGTFVCEYIGEIISNAEANRRKDDVYLFDLDEKDHDGYTLDARRFGNVARFINHKCDANLAPIKVFAGHQDLRFPRICLFAVRDIRAFEELGYDYGPNFWMVKCTKFTCSCGARECRYSRAKLAETAEQLKMAGQLSPTFVPPLFADTNNDISSTAAAADVEQTTA